MNERHLRAWFAVFVAAVFMAGIGIGLIVDRYVAPARAVRADTVAAGRLAGRGGAGAFGPAMMTHRLAAELNLSSNQQKQIDEIFSRRRERLQQIRGEVRAKFESEQRELRDEISKVLTPDQQKRFDQWLLEPAPGMRHGAGRGMGPGRGGRY